MTNAITLDGRTAVVTGASRGAGRGIATVFSQAGANVILFARTKYALDALAESLSPERTVAVAGDVTVPEDVRRAITTAQEQFGRLDVFCHNAGIYPDTPLDQISLEEWHHVIDTNLTSTFIAVKECLPVMRSQNYGRIVLISSITGSRTGYPGLASYSASKAGMLGFMRTAAVELAPFMITINGIEPGSVRTEGLDGLGQEAIASMIEHIPLHSLGEPSDVAHTALFLASEAARYITGQSIVVDGGQTLPELPI